MSELPQFRYRRLSSRKEQFYRRLYEFTNSACGSCVQSGCACSDNICQHVEEQATRRGQKLTKGTHPVLRFIGATGCTVPPHLRETCTIFLCEKAKGQTHFDRERYARLKSICEKIEWKLMELEERYGLGNLHL